MHDLPKLNQDDTENSNSSVTTNKIGRFYKHLTTKKKPRSQQKKLITKFYQTIKES